MTRFASLIALALALTLGAAGCDKPDEASCRKAIDNMRVLMGTDNLSDNNKLEGEVRRCKGGSSKKAVQCAIDAKTYAELRSCGFSKLPADLPIKQGTPGPTAPTPATGSGTAGSADGSAAGSGAAMAGSGSAMAGSGSAMAGSGSATAGSGSATTGSGSAK